MAEQIFASIIGVLIAGSVWGFKCFSNIKVGNVGVLTRFGKFNRILNPGLHFKWPFENVVSISNIEHGIELGKNSEVQLLTEDMMPLTAQCDLRYKINSEKIATLKEIAFGFDDFLKLLKNSSECILRNEVANFSGAYQEVRKNRATISMLVQKSGDQKFEKKYGVQIEGVDILGLVPPHEVLDALNSVQQASENAQTIYSKAIAECEQKVLSAQRSLEIAENAAETTYLEITQTAQALNQLADQGELSHYLAIKRADVFSQSKVLYLKGNLV